MGESEARRPQESQPHHTAGVFSGSAAWEKPCNNEERLVVVPSQSYTTDATLCNRATL